MPLIAIPNVSEGRNHGLLREISAEVTGAGAKVLDLHVDTIHNRSVFTLTAPTQQLVTALLEAARVAQVIDLRRHRGIHPRLGGLDVCPLVPHGLAMAEAVRAAHQLGADIARELAMPVYYYGRAALRSEAEELPSLRRGGLESLIARAGVFPPDQGPSVISPQRGVICVGARSVLIAFNVCIEGGVEDARSIAREIRAASGGLPGVRALGLRISERRAQVSMNLVDPDSTGIDEAFGAVYRCATARGLDVLEAEIVGLVPRRYAPDPDAQAARLLKRPGRILEEALKD